MSETTGGVLRRGSDRIVGGVASGLAQYFGIDVLLVRIVFVILALAPPGIGIILYLVLWFLMEPPAGAPLSATRTIGDRFRTMWSELGEDFRSGFSRSEGPPSGGATAPGTPPSSPGSPPNRGWWSPGYGGRPRGFWAGVILIVLGAYFLLSNIGVLSGFRWDIFWPAVLIAIGLLILVRRR
jgi:phage shock protein C